MNVFSLIVAGLLVVLTLFFAFMLTSAIVFNLKAGQRYRKSLATRVQQLRLSRMLTSLGIDVDRYLHSERIVDIEQQMQRCSACENTDTCDDQLTQGDIDVAEIGFCNNEQSLQDMAQRNRQPS